ncbi:MarR family transcriptional regulator [Streptomyces sp. NPDC006265]|uniref:MarR family winged helix-turn-helix transcriptional regulator n=1 Tax=Streptomyces sp. NPDC006265 TaxID=3156740 RepID=UPI0033A582BC
MEPETFPEGLADALVGVQRLIGRRLRGQMPDPRLRGAEVELLRLVVTRPGIGISDAAKGLGLAANSVSTLVNQLAKAGYLVRETDPADRRAARLLPTPAAETRLREWRRRRAELVRRHVSRLDEQDRRALYAAIPALRKLAGPLHEEAEES